MVDMNEEEAETEWERCSPCPLCGMACSVDHDNGFDEWKCSHSITQRMGIHEWTRERPACSKTKTEGVEDTSLSATSSQALPIQDAATHPACRGMRCDICASKCSSSTAAQPLKLTALHGLWAHATAAAIRNPARSALSAGQKRYSLSYHHCPSQWPQS